LLETGQTGEFHEHRKMYETTVAMINEKMTTLLDRWQTKAQTLFPHYYERFKTDGVEHNLYIGQSITPNRAFEYIRPIQPALVADTGNMPDGV
jgi:hypothetical protein